MEEQIRQQLVAAMIEGWIQPTPPPLVSPSRLAFAHPLLVTRTPHCVNCSEPFRRRKRHEYDRTEMIMLGRGGGDGGGGGRSINIMAACTLGIAVLTLWGVCDNYVIILSTPRKACLFK